MSVDVKLTCDNHFTVYTYIKSFCISKTQNNVIYQFYLNLEKNLKN